MYTLLTTGFLMFVFKSFSESLLFFGHGDGGGGVGVERERGNFDGRVLLFPWK